MPVTGCGSLTSPRDQLDGGHIPAPVATEQAARERCTMSTETILALEDRRYRAMIDADLAALDELCAPNLRYAHTTGEYDTKESYLKKVADGYFDYQRIDHPVDQVIIEGNAALVFGRMTIEVNREGAHKKMSGCTLSVWLEQADGWRFVAFQPTLIP
jgi:ketosteroid isomerase-like protein